MIYIGSATVKTPLNIFVTAKTHQLTQDNDSLPAAMTLTIAPHNHTTRTDIRAHVSLCLYISIFGPHHPEAFFSRLRHDASSLTSHHFTTCTSDAAHGPQPASSHHHRTYAEIAGGSEERSSHDRQNINSLPGSAPC